MYDRFRKQQNSFFSSSEDVLKHFPTRFNLSTNQHGLYVLKIDDTFVASFYPHERESALLYYGNKVVSQNLKA